MMRFMNAITDKPNWNVRVFDESIAEKWKAEALAPGDEDVTPKMLEWCIAEIQYVAKIFQRRGFLNVYTGDVVKSDTAISPSLRQALKEAEAVATLESVPDREKDWHPGSDKKVLDLVHPSLFPLVYGRSRVLREGVAGLDNCIERYGEGEVLGIPKAWEAREKYENRRDSSKDDAKWHQAPYSRKFQWLPCEVDISGDEARITSYINNLHPEEYKPLYSLIEQIISRAIPLWNATLTPLRTPESRFVRIVYDEVKYEYDSEDEDDTEEPQRLSDEDEEEYDIRREDWFSETSHSTKLPEPEIFIPPHERDAMKVDLRREYGSQGLQVVVKLANIHLTPEKPEYKGGSWHVEGQLNEHISATALYYYDNENITSSNLAFRQQCNTEVINISHDYGQKAWLEEVFGCDNDGPAVQDIGAVETREGRLITFPNVLQHQVQPFKLVDPTKSGHRKMVALFLVDPHIRIISTAHVPPQQKDWWMQAIKQNRRLERLPVELQKLEDFPIDFEEAKQMRLKLMEERKAFVVGQRDMFEGTAFSLCEH
ncbi:hypothetical protein BDQ12DRAFT_610196 [Crucibulum laeve]|uniref:Uncharacterized protein n=1 Tax=Crucibulum laeve TaxID=68775 RepID=A0A5C3LWB4_9AGAR|nr:hypothetical protein BDQ12DRAFT_610196 [Crucibulum laeve]